MATDPKKNAAPAAAAAGATEKTDGKTNRERFTSTAVNRVNNVLDALRVLGNCADRANYEYTAEEWAKISAAIDAKLAETKALFTDALAGKSKKAIKQGFSI